jgi:hypothetical protein
MRCSKRPDASACATSCAYDGDGRESPAENAADGFFMRSVPDMEKCSPTSALGA